MTANTSLRLLQWKRQFQQFATLLILLGWLALGSGLSLALEGRIVVAGLHIRDLREQRAMLERSVADLNTRLAVATSYEVMAERAAALGYRPATPADMVFVPVMDYQPVEFAPSQPTPLPDDLDPALLPPAYREGWLDRLPWLRLGGRP